MLVLPVVLQAFNKGDAYWGKLLVKQEPKWPSPGGVTAGAAAQAGPSAGQPPHPGLSQLSQLSQQPAADVVMGHLGHGVVVAGGWCRLSTNYTTPSHLLSRLTGYKQMLMSEQRVVSAES